MTTRVVFLVITLLSMGCAPRIEKSIAQGDALRGTQQFAEALQVYEAIVAAEPNDARIPEVLLRIGDLYTFNLKQSEPARAVYQRIVAQWPRSSVAVTVYLRLADLAENAGDRPGVIEPLEYLLRYFPVHPERHAVRQRIARQYLLMKSYEQARIELHSILDAPDVPSDIRAQLYLDMADTYLLPKKYASALEWLQRARDAATTDDIAAQARRHIIDVRMEMGDHSAALAEESLQADAAQAQLNPPAAPAVDTIPPMHFATGRVVVTPVSGTAQTLTVEIAATAAERERGLMYRTALAKNAGMWFVFPQAERASFWMKDTAIALDILFVDAAGRVVDLIANTTPFSEKPLTPQLPFQTVLEVNAGYAAQHGITVGAVVQLQSK